MLSILLATVASTGIGNFVAGATATLTVYSIAKTGKNTKVKL